MFLDGIVIALWLFVWAWSLRKPVSTLPDHAL